MLKILSEALWKQDNVYHGAAIMVGAGSSRAAVMAEDAQWRLPLWSDLYRALAAEMRADVRADLLRLSEDTVCFEIPPLGLRAATY